MTDTLDDAAWRRVLFVAACWAILVVAAALRFFDLGGPSLWLDELRSLHDSETLPRSLVGSYHPPTSYVALWAARAVLGDGDTAVRAPSALAGTLAVAATMWLAARLGTGRVGALAAGALLALAPAAVGLAREARMYAWLMLACALAVAAVEVVLRSPTRGRALAAGAAAAFALTVHAYGAVFTAPALVVAAFALRARSADLPHVPHVRHVPHTARPWHLFAIPSLVFVALVLRVALRPDGHIEEPISYAARHVSGGGAISPLTAAARLFWFRPWAYELEDPYVLGAWALAMGAVAYVALLRPRAPMDEQPTRTWARRAALASLLVPAALLCVLPVKNATRLFTPALPLAVAVALVAMTALPRRWMRIAYAVSLACAAVTTIPFLLDVYRLELEPWRAVCARVDARPGPVLISARYAAPAYRRCAPDTSGPSAGLVVPYPDDTLDADAAVASVRSGGTIWLVASHTNRPSTTAVDGDGERAAARALSATHQRVSVDVLSPLLRVERWERRVRDGPTDTITP